MARKEKERQKRKEPLSCSFVRAFYTRSRGVPLHSLTHHHHHHHHWENGTATNLHTKPSSSSSTCCPLQPGIYHALPRSWCHGWRKYLKTGENIISDNHHALYPPPDASACLCDAHKLPLVPPHLNAFLRGKTPSLMSSINVEEGMDYNGDAECHVVLNRGYASSTRGGVVSSSLYAASSSPVAAPAASFPGTPCRLDSKLPAADRFQPDNYNNGDDDHANDEQDKGGCNEEEQDTMMEALYAAGFSEADVQSQRLAMMNLEKSNKYKQKQQHHSTTISSPVGQGVASFSTTTPPPPPPAQSPQIHETTNERLDKENKVVVEILTEEEYVALEKWWPSTHRGYALRFAITQNLSGNNTEIVWNTMPCRDCDATGRSLSVTRRCRSKRWEKKR